MLSLRQTETTGRLGKEGLWEERGGLLEEMTPRGETGQHVQRHRMEERRWHVSLSVELGARRVRRGLGKGGLEPGLRELCVGLAHSGQQVSER